MRGARPVRTLRRVGGRRRTDGQVDRQTDSPYLGPTLLLQVGTGLRSGAAPLPSRSGGTDRGWLGRARSPSPRARQTDSARVRDRHTDRKTDRLARQQGCEPRPPATLARCLSFLPPATYLPTRVCLLTPLPGTCHPPFGARPGDRGPSALARPGPNTRARSHDSKSPTWPRPGSSPAFPTEIGGPASPRHADTPLFLARPPAAAGRTVGRVSGRMSLFPNAPRPSLG